MNKVYQIKGMINNFDKKILFKKANIQVNLTIDKYGATLSVGDGDLQYMVPFDRILNDILEEQRNGQKEG